MNRFQLALHICRSLLVSDNLSEVGEADVVLVCQDADRRKTVDDNLGSPLLDPIAAALTALGYTTRMLTFPFSTIRRELIGVETYTFNRLYLKRSLLNRWRSVRRKRLPSTNWKVEFWSEILEITGCRAVILIGAPSELCVAASQRCVSVVEVLHGFGYHVLPWDYKARSAESLPTHFISFDETSFNTFSEMLRHLGIRTYLSAPPNTNVRRVAKSQRSSSKPAIAVLFSLGWMEFESGRLEEIPDDKVWPSLIDEVDDLSKGTIKWFVRPHPVMLRAPHFERHRKRILESIDRRPTVMPLDEAVAPLELLLTQVDAHVTSFSEIAFEVAYAGIPTLFVSQEVAPGGLLVGRYQELFRAGLAESVNGNPKIVLDWLRRAQSRDYLALSCTNTTLAETVRELVRTGLFDSTRGEDK